MKALYRRYRPTALADVVGQEAVTTVLQRALDSGKISHAYIFAGPRGTGKTSVARIFAHAVNGFPYHIEDNYIDIIEIDAATHTGVDDIRALHEQAVIAPTEGKYKVYLIDEFHMLSKSAFNALLKLLEEPPAHVVFLLATTDLHKVPITITSRAQTFTFSLAAPEVMQAHLATIAEKEGIKIADDALALIVRRGGGSFRDSLSLLDQASALVDAGTEISAERLRSAFGLPEDQLCADLLAAYAAGDAARIAALLQSLLAAGLQPLIIASELVERILAAPTPELLPLLDRLCQIDGTFPAAKLLTALLLTDRPTSAPLRPLAPAPAAPVAPNPARLASAPAPQPAAPTAAGSAEKPASAPTAAPAENSASTPVLPVENSQPAPAATAAPNNAGNNPTNFDWAAFIEPFATERAAVASRLRSARHELAGTTLHIYPNSKFSYQLLSKDDNRRLVTARLAEFAPDFTLELHDPTKPAENSTHFSKISAIMGEIQEVDLPNGGHPF